MYFRHMTMGTRLIFFTPKFLVVFLASISFLDVSGLVIFKLVNLFAQEVLPPFTGWWTYFIDCAPRASCYSLSLTLSMVEWLEDFFHISVHVCPDFFYIYSHIHLSFLLLLFFIDYLRYFVHRPFPGASYI